MYLSVLMYVNYNEFTVVDGRVKPILLGSSLSVTHLRLKLPCLTAAHAPFIE